jgi:predicted phosphodiesterase
LSGRTLELAERRILVVHDPREIEAGLAGHTVVLHGHDHRRRIERRDGALIVNPGECAGFLPGHNAVAVVDLAALAVQVLLF